MSIGIAERAEIPSFIVMDVMQAAADREAAGGDVLHLEVGQPSTGAPRGVVEAAKTALDSQTLGYTVAFGLPALRQRIADLYRDWYGVSVPIERIAVTTGSSAGFLLSFSAAFAPGDRVALASPGYPCYRNILSALGVEPVTLLATAEERFQPTPELLDKAGKIDGLIVASPSNPTGTMLDKAHIQALTDYCRKKGIRMISDEIYHGISYGQTAVSALECDPDVVIINSFSKYFSMTGWRLGWMVLPEDMVAPVERLAQNMFISAPTLSQVAGIAAFDCHEECQDNLARYTRNREVLLNDLPKAGLTDFAPADGAFYIYADVSRYTNDSVAFCRRILKETGIACTPGVDFDPDRGNTGIRFSFAGATDDMIEAAKRLKEWLA